MTNPMLALSAEVSAALAARRPVVALESTIIAHGMPWPENIDTARAVEAIVRETGATPATIAVIGGKIRVGLSDDELVGLARANDVLKLSRAGLTQRMQLDFMKRDETVYLDPLESIVDRNETQAAALLKLYEGPWKKSVDPIFDLLAY